MYKRQVYGDLMQLLTVMKGTALAYNKDFQEDKESVFDAIDTWKATIDIFAKMLDKTEFRMDQIEKQLSKGFLNATDLSLIHISVTIEEGNKVTVKGPKGELVRVLPAEMEIKLEDGQVVVTRPNDLKKMKSLHGLTRCV